MQVFEKIKYNLMVLAEETYYKSVDGDTNAGQRNSAYHKAIQIVEKVAEEYNNGWIPCSERLPDKNRYYLVTQLVPYDGKDVCNSIIEFVDGKWQGVGADMTPYVIAWQPLPEPYQQKGE